MTADDHERFYGSPPPARPADPPASAASGRTYRDPSGGGYPAPGPGPAPSRGYSNYSERAPEPTLRYEEPREREREREYEAPAPSPAGALPPAPKRRHWGRRFAILIGILLVLLIAADRIGVVVAENVAATQVQKEQKLPQKPGISIKGIPFLTQVAARDFSHITVDIRGLESTGVPITDIHADLYGVHVDSSFNGGTADTVNAVAELSYSDISTAVDNQIGSGFGQVTVSEGSNNQLQASYSIAGVSVSASVAVALEPHNVIKLTSGQVQTPLSGLGINLGDTSGFTASIPLGNLPFGIQLTGINVTKGYVGITATGHNVPLQESSSSG